MSGHNSTSDAYHPLLVFTALAFVAVPAALLTVVLDSVLNQSHGFRLYLPVVLVPALIGFVAYALAGQRTPNATPALARGVVVSFFCSLLTTAFVYIAAFMGWL